MANVVLSVMLAYEIILDVCTHCYADKVPQSFTLYYYQENKRLCAFLFFSACILILASSLLHLFYFSELQNLILLSYSVPQITGDIFETMPVKLRPIIMQMNIWMQKRITYFKRYKNLTFFSAFVLLDILCAWVCARVCVKGNCSSSCAMYLSRHSSRDKIVTLLSGKRNMHFVFCVSVASIQVSRSILYSCFTARKLLFSQSFQGHCK